MTRDVLTPKKEAYAVALASGLSQAEAYRQAYPASRKWADTTVWPKASALAKDDKVRARFEELRQKACDANEVSIERIVAELAKIAFGDLRSVMTWGPSGVVLKKSDELTDDAAAALAEVSETVGKQGVSLKVRRVDKLGALRTLAEMKGALVKKHEVTGANGKDLVPEPKGMLVVPGMMSSEAWEEMMERERQGVPA